MEVLPLDSDFFKALGGQIVHDGFRCPDELDEFLSLARIVEIKHKAALVGVEIMEKAGLFGIWLSVGFREGPSLSERIASRAFHLDDIGPEVGHPFGGPGRRNAATQFDDAQSTQVDQILLPPASCP